MATQATATTEVVPPAATAPAWTKWLAPLVSAGLLYLSFFPVAWGWLGWVALVPLLCLVRLPGQPRWRKMAAYLGGLAFFLPVLQWFRVADPRMYLTWIAMSVYLAVYWPTAISLLRLIERRTRLPLILTFPVVWVSLDFVRWGIFGSFASLISGSHQHDLPGGFSWYYLGHTQHDFLEMIQIADIAGVYGVTFIVAAVNALLFEILFVRGWFRRVVLGDGSIPMPGRRGLLVQSLIVGGCLLACLGYGVWRMGQNTSTPGPRVAFLQGSVPQGVRNKTIATDAEERDRARRTLERHYIDLAERAAKERPDLIVFPETSFPGGWRELEPGLPNYDSSHFARDLMAALHTPVLLGMTALVARPGDRPWMYNSAILLGRDASRSHWLGRYDKIHRVPFGEYTPFGDAMTWLSWLSPYDEGDYSVHPGTQFTYFELPLPQGTYRFGVVICYEDTDPSLARSYVAGSEAPADFLLNISNDGWFDGTSEHDQHLAICRFRAVECRRSMGRAVNMGISALIDSNGRILAPISSSDKGVWMVPEKGSALAVSRWWEFKKVSGILVGRMPIDSRSTLYARIGDTFAIGCLGLLGLTLVGLVFGSRRTVG